MFVYVCLQAPKEIKTNVRPCKLICLKFKERRREGGEEWRIERKKGKYLNKKLYTQVYIYIHDKGIQHEANDVTESNIVGLWFALFLSQPLQIWLLILMYSTGILCPEEDV